MLYKSKELLKSCLQNSEFAHLAPNALEVCRTSFQLHRELSQDEELPVGISKIGGLPDVPPDFIWPVCSAIEDSDYLEKQVLSAPLWFLGQIETSLLGCSDWPCSTGSLLSFFSAIQRDGFPVTGGRFDDWKVFHFEKENLRRAIPPALPTKLVEALSKHDFELPLTGPPCFRPARIQCCDEDLKCALPGWWPDVVTQHSAQQREDLLRVLRSTEQVTSDCSLHLALGYPQGMNPAGTIVGKIARLVHPLRVEENASVQEQIRADKLDDQEWVLLAQFGTDEDLQLYWPGWGQAYFVIRRGDLLAGAFERTVLINDHG